MGELGGSGCGHVGSFTRISYLSWLVPTGGLPCEVLDVDSDADDSRNQKGRFKLTWEQGQD